MNRCEAASRKTLWGKITGNAKHSWVLFDRGLAIEVCEYCEYARQDGWTFVAHVFVEGPLSWAICNKCGEHRKLPIHHSVLVGRTQKFKEKVIKK